ncbi:phospholipase C/P1 nuclease domain-containing protein, partial [Mycena leptocephala]
RPRVGHPRPPTVAYVAQNYLTPTAAAWAKTVLNDTSTSYLANIASWADTYPGAWSVTPLHFIDAEDNPPTSCSVDYTRDCGASGCSISAIANYTQRWQGGRWITRPRCEEGSAQVLAARSATSSWSTSPSWTDTRSSLPVPDEQGRARARRGWLPTPSRDCAREKRASAGVAWKRAATAALLAECRAPELATSLRTALHLQTRHLRAAIPTCACAGFHTFCMIRGVGFDFRIRATPT